MNYNLIDKGTDITRIDISFGSVKKMPILPLKLEKLYVDNNLDLEELPMLPCTLRVLSICLTAVYKLPPLPETLEELYVSDNPGIIIDSLPKNLKIFVANSCELESIPLLPAGLTTLSVDANYLEFLPTLPSTIQTLIASNNELLYLESTFISNLSVCMLNNNCLKRLPSFQIPSKLIDLNCAENNLKRLPNIPLGIRNFVWYGNPLIYEFHNKKIKDAEYVNRINRFVEMVALSTIKHFLIRIIHKKRIEYYKHPFCKSISSLSSSYGSSFSLSSLGSCSETWNAEEEFVLI
jgi:hypothetical protein